MRHRVKRISKLGRKSDHRGLLARNLATSLVLHEKIQTTATKANFAQSFVEKLITSVKKKSNDREAIRVLKTKLLTEKAQKKMLTDLAKRYAERKSGFTRITPLGMRIGDGGHKVLLELV
jgi:large subunit ribosomal protein L17